jgi:hypothetical protein
MQICKGEDVERSRKRRKGEKVDSKMITDRKERTAFQKASVPNRTENQMGEGPASF